MKFYELFIAWRYMVANIKQSLIIILAVSIGVAIIIWVPSINLSFFDDLIDKSVSSSPHISVTKEIDTFVRDEKLLNKEFNNKLLLIDQTRTRKRNIISVKGVLDKIKQVQGIVATAPYASGQAFVIRGAEERGVSIRGVVPEQETIITDIENDMVSGNFTELGVNDIIIGIQLADKLNVGLNDRVTVTGPRRESKNLKITGIFETGLRSRDENSIYVSLKSAQQLLELGNDVSGIGIKVNDIYKADVIAKEIELLTGLDARSWQEDNQQILDQINRFKLIIAFINFLIIFSAASSITSVFILLIASKSKEIGILKSMGSKNISVMAIFVFQAIILSVIGYLFGLLGAKLLLWWYANILSTSGGTMISTDIPEFKMNLFYTVLALFYSIFTSLIASVLPAYQAAKLNPVEAINA